MSILKWRVTFCTAIQARTWPTALHIMRIVNMHKKREQVSGALAQLRNATISFVVFVRPSVHMEQLGSHWADCREILYLSIFRKHL